MKSSVVIVLTSCAMVFGQGNDNSVYLRGSRRTPNVTRSGISRRPQGSRGAMDRPVPYSAVQVIRNELPMIDIMDDYLSILESNLDNLHASRSVITDQLAKANRKGLRNRLTAMTHQVDQATTQVQTHFRKAVQLFKNVLRGAVDGRLTPGARAHQSMVQAATQIDREAQPVIKLVRPTKDAAYRLLKGGEFSPGELLRDALNLSNDHQGLRALLVVIDIISGDARNSSRVPPNPAPVPKKPKRPRKPVRNVG